MHSHTITPTHTPKTDELAEVISAFNQLDNINQLIVITLIEGLADKNLSQIKLALDWSIEHNGPLPELLGAYDRFGVAPESVEVNHG